MAKCNHLNIVVITEFRHEDIDGEKVAQMPLKFVECGDCGTKLPFKTITRELRILDTNTNFKTIFSTESESYGK